MGWLLLIGAVIGIIWVIWNFVSNYFQLFLDLVQACLPILLLSIAIGLAGLKRKEKAGAVWMIIIGVIAQIVAISMITFSGPFHDRLRWYTQTWDTAWMEFYIVVIVIVVSVTFAIPGWVMIKKSKA